MCKVCNVEKSADASSAANLRRHVTTMAKCKDAYRAWVARKDAEKNKGKRQMVLTADSFKPKSQREMSSERKREIDGWVEELILECELPLELVRTQGFRTFMERMQPAYTVIASQTLRERFIRSKKAYTDKTKNALEKAEHVTVMMDAWTNRRMESFMGAMAYVHETRKWHLLCCEKVTFRHTAVNVAKWFKERIIDEFSLIKSLVRVGSDSAANMMKTFRKDLKFEEEVDEANLEKDHGDDEVAAGELVEILEEDEEKEPVEPEDHEANAIDPAVVDDAMKSLAQQLTEDATNLVHQLRSKKLLKTHYRCVCHLLQRVVVEFSTKNRKDISHTLRQCKALCNSIRKSHVDMDALRELGVNLVAPEDTRWTGTFSMLDSIQKAMLKNALDNLNSTKVRLTRMQQNLVAELVDAFEPMFNFSMDMQAGEGSAATLIPSLQGMKDALLSTSQDWTGMNKRLEDMISAKFEETLDDPFYKLATMTDPRVASFLIQEEQCNVLLKKAMEVAEHVKQAQKAQNARDMTAPAPEVPKISPTPKGGAKRRSSLWSAAVKRPCQNDESRTITEELGDFTREVTNIKEELDTVEDGLNWLETRKNKFPRVFALSHVYRSVASTAEVERLFSICTRLTRPTRASMSARLLEALVTIKMGRKVEAAERAE